VLDLTGTTLNALVIAGLMMALLVVIDDAVTDVENMSRRMRLARAGDERPAASSIIAASLEMRGPLGYAALILVLAVAPAFLMESLSGAFFTPLAFSYLVAVLASVVAALMVTPVLAVTLLKTTAPGRVSPLVAWLHKGYGAVLSRVLARPAISFVAVGVVALLGLLAWPQLGQSLFPAFRERDLLVHWDAPQGASLPEEVRMTRRAARELRSLPGVSDVNAHVGRAVMSDRAVDVNSGEIWVNVGPRADYESTLAGIQRVVNGYPGLSHGVQTYLNERINQVLTGTRDPIVVRIYGSDLRVLRHQAEEIGHMLSGIGGIVDPHIEQQVDEPTLEIKVDLAAAQSHGLKPGDVRRAAATMVSGIQVGSLFERQKVFDVQVWGEPATRHSDTSVRNLLIDTPGGGQVRLASVADVRVTPQPAVVKREAVSRRIDVAAGVEGGDPGAIAGEVQRRLQEMSFPLEYHAELLGQYAERRSVQNHLVAYVIAAAIGIFLLFQAAFSSWRLASILFAALLLSAVGGLLGAWAGGGAMSIGSLVGFLGIVAISSRHGLTLLDRFRRLEDDEGLPWGPDLVRRGALERMGPISTATTAAILAFLPAVVSGDIAGLEIVHPMAVVIVAGVIVSALVNLLVLPVLYLCFGRGTGSPGPEMGSYTEASGGAG
jgi:Cu/Ag efflux pump CusA